MADQASPSTPAPPQTASSETSKADVFQTGKVLTIAAGHAVHDTYTGFLPPLLPDLIAAFNLSNAQAGLLSAFTQLPSVLQPFIGHLADRLSLRYLVILAPAITATMMSLLGVAPSYLVAALLLTVAGLSSAGLHAVGPAMAGRISGDKLGRGMSFWMVGGELGRTLGPVLVVSAITLLSLQGIAWLMVAGWLASLLLYLRLRGVSGRPEIPQGAMPWRTALRNMRPLFVPLALYLAVSSFINIALTTYLPTFLREQGSGLWLAGASLSILEAAGVAGALVGGSLSDHLGRRRVLAASMAINTVLMFIFVSTQGWVRTALLPILGFTSLARTPVVMAMVQQTYPENRALANGSYMALSFLIRSGMLVVFGALADVLGLRSVFALSAFLLLVGMPAIWFFPAPKQDQGGESDGAPVPRA